MKYVSCFMNSNNDLPNYKLKINLLTANGFANFCPFLVHKSIDVELLEDAKVIDIFTGMSYQL